METVNLGELDKLETTYRRDLNCLKDLSRQRRLAALCRLTAFFRNQVDILSGNSNNKSSSLEQPPGAKDECHHSRGRHSNSVACLPQDPATPYYSSSSVSQFFLSHVYKPCVKLSSEDASDDCREAAVNLLRSCVKDLLSVDQIQGLVLRANASGTYAGFPQLHGGTAESKIKDNVDILEEDLIIILLNRLQGTPFNESSEEVRYGILDIFLYLLRETACPAASPLAAEPPHFPGSEEDNNFTNAYTQNQTNEYPRVQQRKTTWQSAATCTGSKDGKDCTVVDKWSLELYAKETIRSVAHTLSDADARNVQIACSIAAAISDRLSAGTLRKESEPLVSALLPKLRHPQRKTRWRALDALQQLVGASQLPGMLMDKAVRALTAFNYEETTSSNRDKLAEVVLHWFRRIPIRCMKRHVPRLLLLLLSCTADEESKALAKRAALDLCLKAQCSLKGHGSKRLDELRESKHGKDGSTAELETCSDARPSTAFSTAQERDEESDGDTEGDTDDDEDTTREVTTVDDLELLKRSWSATSDSAYAAPEQGSDLDALTCSYESLSSFLPFPFHSPTGTTLTEPFTTSSEDEGRTHPRQQSCDAAQLPLGLIGNDHQYDANDEETGADSFIHPLDIARLAYMLRHVASELVQQALTEDSDFGTSPARCCRSLRTLRLLAALLFASPTVTEKPHFSAMREELIRPILLHLYKICHHADTLALQQSACVDDGGRSRATTGSSSLVEYAFLVASSQTQIIKKQAEEDQQAERAAPAKGPIAEECSGSSRILCSRAGTCAEQDVTLSSIGGAASQQNCPDLQDNATASFENKAAFSRAQQTSHVWEEVPREVTTSGALKSCLQIVEEARNCSATIAAVAAPYTWLKPIAEHVLGSDAELVRAYKQRVPAADAPQQGLVKGEEDHCGREEASVHADSRTSARSSSGRLPDKEGETRLQNGSERGAYPKSVTEALGYREEAVQSQNPARKNELCGRPQYAFLLLGSMLWTIRKKRRFWGARPSLIKGNHGGGDVTASGENVASAAGPPVRDVAADGERGENARVFCQQSKCGEFSQWTADEARVCFGVVEQLVYPDGSQWNGGNKCSSELTHDSNPYSKGKREMSIANGTASPCLLSAAPGALLARSRQLPDEDDSVILLFATSVIPVLVDVCRTLCKAEWSRILFVLIRLRVEHKASPLLVESALEFLSFYSRKSPATLFHYFLSFWVSSEQKQLRLFTSSTRAEPLSLSETTDCHAYDSDNGSPCRNKSSSFVDAWSLSDPRRLMLLYVLKRLRSASPSPVSLDEGSECNTCPSSMSTDHGQDVHLEIKQHLVEVDGQHVTERHFKQETFEAFLEEIVPPAGATADLAYDSTSAVASTDQNVSASKTPFIIPLQGSDSGVHNFSRVGHWLPPLLKILARQASPEDVTPLVRVDVLECIFELLENPSACRYCGRYGRFVLERAIKPNLQWRPGEANAKLRKAALVCVDSIFTSVATALANTNRDVPSCPTAADDFEMEPHNGDTICYRVSEPPAPLPSHAKSSATNPPKAVKLESRAQTGGAGTAGLPTVETAYKTMRVLVNLIESLLPCMLSCLEDDAQPETRKMTAETLTHFLRELEACRRSPQQTRPKSSADAASDTVSLAGTAGSACASERGADKGSHSSAVAGSPTAVAKAPRNLPVAGDIQSPLFPDNNVSLLPEPKKANLPRQHGDATGSMQHEFMSFCSALYPALLQRMDDARDTVRLAAAAALCTLLRFLRCLKADHDRQERQQQQQLVCRSEDGHGAAQQLLDVSNEVQKGRHATTTGGAALCVHVDAKKQEKKVDAPAISKTPQWRWPCLDYVVRGVLTFLDDQDENLAALVHEILRLAGDLNAPLVLQEVQGAAPRCIHLKRYEAVRDAVQGRSI